MTGALGCPISGRFTIPSFPLDVGHLEQGYVIFEANSVEVIKRQIAFHGLAKILCGRIKIGEYRCLHYNFDPLLPMYFTNCSRHINRNFKSFLYVLADRGFPGGSLVLYIHHREIVSICQPILYEGTQLLHRGYVLRAIEIQKALVRWTGDGQFGVQFDQMGQVHRERLRDVISEPTKP